MAGSWVAMGPTDLARGGRDNDDMGDEVKAMLREKWGRLGELGWKPTWADQTGLGL